MNLKDWMNEAGLTQAEVATKIGCSQSYLARIISSGTASLDIALTIHDLTDNAVSLRSLSKSSKVEV